MSNWPLSPPDINQWATRCCLSWGIADDLVAYGGVIPNLSLVSLEVWSMALLEPSKASTGLKETMWIRLYL